jgi:hypothetical protein
MSTDFTVATTAHSQFLNFPSSAKRESGVERTLKLGGISSTISRGGSFGLRRHDCDNWFGVGKAGYRFLRGSRSQNTQETETWMRVEVYRKRLSCGGGYWKVWWGGVAGLSMLRCSCVYGLRSCWCMDAAE